MRLLKFLIDAYRLALSPLMPPACRFEPSCSRYALESLELHGARGILLTLFRLGRCHPFSACGYDPVPRPDFKYG